MKAAALSWDVVRVDFPYADRDSGGVRPALVVATPAATDAFAVVWVLMITSARQARWLDDVEVTDLTSDGLSHASLVRTAKIAAIDSRRVTTIGRLTEPDRTEVSQRLRGPIGGVLSG